MHSLTPPRGLSRRTLAAAAAAVFAPTLWIGARAQPAPPRVATPSQTEGPFYPVELPRDSDNDLLQNGSLAYRGGQPAWIDGLVLDLQGRPVRGAAVEIWQCDEGGHYHHPGDGNRADAAFQGFGKASVDADGGFRFRTIRPVPYSGRTPHVHVKVRLGARELLTTQLYVAGDPGNDRDFLWRNLAPQDRAAVTVPFRRSADGWQASFPIVVRA
jgi:protocatechuate 3,4-dioxygenase, beta subunit